MQGSVAFLPFGETRLTATKPTEFQGVPQTLGDHLRRRRLKLGLYQREVAARLGVNVWTIQNWETGRVASRKIQERLRALMDGRQIPRNPGPAATFTPRGGDTAMATTGEIVAAYLRTQKAIKPEQLDQLVRSVKRALTS